MNHREDDLPASDVVELDGRAVSSALRCVLETAVTQDVESATVTITSALRPGLISEADLERSIVDLRHGPACDVRGWPSGSPRAGRRFVFSGGSLSD